MLAPSENPTASSHIPPSDWEAYIEQISEQIVQERSPARLRQVRDMLYDLITHCIPPTTVIKVGSLRSLYPSCMRLLVQCDPKTAKEEWGPSKSQSLAKLTSLCYHQESYLELDL